MQLLAAALFWIFRWFCKRIKFLSAGRMFWLPYLFFVLAIWSLMLWPIPFWGESVASLLAYMLSALFGFVGSLIGGSAGIIASILLILVLLGTIADLWDKKPDSWAKYSTFALAPLALVASAEFAPGVLAVVETVGGLGPELLTSMA